MEIPSNALDILNEGGLVVGIVVNQDGTMSADTALSEWNAANPSYQGDTAMEGPFLLH